MAAICRAEEMPGLTTIYRWLQEKPEFRELYVRAREDQADTLADEILEIADDGHNDWMERFNKDGDCVGWTVNGEAVMRSKLRVESRKWVASKLKPKKYGDKQTVDVGSDPERPLISKVVREIVRAKTSDG